MFLQCLPVLLKSGLQIKEIISAPILCVGKTEHCLLSVSLRNWTWEKSRKEFCSAFLGQGSLFHLNIKQNEGFVFNAFVSFHSAYLY